MTSQERAAQYFRKVTGSPTATIDELNELLDDSFWRRLAPRPTPEPAAGPSEFTLTIRKLIEKKNCVVRCDGKKYRIAVTECRE